MHSRASLTMLFPICYSSLAERLLWNSKITGIGWEVELASVGVGVGYVELGDFSEGWEDSFLDEEDRFVIMSVNDFFCQLDGGESKLYPHCKEFLHFFAGRVFKDFSDAGNECLRCFSV